MRIYLLFTTLCFFLAVRGQNTETDSLKRLLAATPNGPGRVVILEGLSYAYLSSYPDTSLQYAQEGLLLARQINDHKGEALCINALGSVYFHVGDYPKSLELYFHSLDIEQSLNNRGKVPATYFNIASVYTEEEDYQHALYYIFKAKEEDERLKDSSGILFDLYSLGSIYLRMGENDSALNYINQSYRIAKDLNDQNMIGAILNTFGEAYAALSNTARASEYYHLSIPHAMAIHDNEVLAANYFGLAKGFLQNKRLDSSIYYARKSLFLAREAPFLKQVMETSAFLTSVFKDRKQFDSAFRYQEISIAARDSLFNVDKTRKIQNLKFQEQQRLQAIETARAEFRNKIKFYAVIAASVIFLGIALLLWQNSRQKHKAFLLLQQQKGMTERAYEDLKSTQAQLIQSAKMASLGELTAGIAHEIQNPLNFVNNFSEVNVELIGELKAEHSKLKTERDDELLKEIINDIGQNEEKIIHHGRRAGAIVNGMLEHSRSSTGQKEPTDINVLAEEYLRMAYKGFIAKDLRNSANKSFHATIKTDFGGNIGKLALIPQDLGRVLLNLYNNAFHAVAEKNASSLRQAQGSASKYEPIVSVTTKRIIDEQDSHQPDSHRVEIKISDNGIGIPSRNLEKIFQPFFTTRPSGEGTGLGLSLSYDIVKSFGGEIKVESKEGEYSNFSILLPAWPTSFDGTTKPDV